MAEIAVALISIASLNGSSQKESARLTIEFLKKNSDIAEISSNHIESYSLSFRQILKEKFLDFCIKELEKIVPPPWYIEAFIKEKEKTKKSKK